MKNSEDEPTTDAAIWDLIYKEAELLYEQYLGVTSFEHLHHSTMARADSPLPNPDFDVSLTVQWNDV